MSREHYEMILQKQHEDAEHLAAVTMQGIDHAISVCGIDMLNQNLTGYKLVPVNGTTAEVPAPFGSRCQH